MVTELQQKFKLEHAKYIVSYLFPEFADIIDEFNFEIRNKYCWVCICAKRPAVMIGIDNRTKKDKKAGVRDPREKIEQSYHIDMGLDNHRQVNHTLWGNRITKSMIQTALETGEIEFHIWNFVYSYGHSSHSEGQGRNPNKEQKEHLTEYLNKQGIGLPTVEEFYNYYYEN